AVNMFPGLVHTARHVMKADNTRSRWANRKEAAVEGGFGDGDEVVTRWPYRKVRLDHLLSRESPIRRFAGGSNLPGRSPSSAQWSAPTRGIGRPRKRDELAALEPTDLPLITRVPVTLQPLKARQPSRWLGRLFAYPRPEPCAGARGAGTMPAPRGAFSSAG